jgi:hypothetical protein
MVAEIVRFDAAQNRQLVHDGGVPRQVLADLNAGHVGGDGLELATDFDGRVS